MSNQQIDIGKLVRQKIDTARGYVDYPVTLIYWAAAVGVTLIFAHEVSKRFGWPIPYIPSMSWLDLVYAAGILYLLAKR